MTTEEKFNAAVNVIRNLPKDGPYQPSNEMMLKFYGLFKQATEGSCNTPKPAFYDVINGYKWKAWKSYGDMSKTEAMSTYVDELKKIIETMSYSDNVAKFMDVLGPFFDYVDLTGMKILPDSNHNIKNIIKMKKSDAKNDDNEAVCNGNGGSDSGSEEVLVEEQRIKYLERESQSGSDGETVAKVDGFVNIYHKQSEVLDSKEFPLKNQKIDVAKRLLSDTDSDEEYSEPAETPECLIDNLLSNGNQIFENGASETLTPPSAKGSVYTHGRNEKSATSKQGGGMFEYSRPMRAVSGSGPPTPTSRHQPTGGGGGGNDGRNPRDWMEATGPRSVAEEVNVQLVLILQKIHQDLQDVLVRLDRLESQAFGQHQRTCHVCQRAATPVIAKNWWPFPDLSLRSTLLLLTWPLILKGALNLFSILRSRRRGRLTNSS